MSRTKQESNFDFIRDKVLRENLDRVFDHIVELISLSESSAYNQILKSSFRKTIIIYTASIIEGLLLYILKQHKTEEECSPVKKEFRIIKVIYQVDQIKKIVLGEHVQKKQRLMFKKINLSQINTLCKDYALIDAELHVRIERVRDLRNRQHLGGLSAVDQDYSKKDLEFVFSVASEVKQLAKA